MMSRPPTPPFDATTATQKVRMAEDAWNSRQPDTVALAYTPGSQWRNRAEIFSGRPAIVDFLIRKWRRELDYRLIKELWAFDGTRIAVRFAYEYRNAGGDWFRAYGNENWDFAPDGLMRHRIASINDIAIAGDQRLMHLPQGPRPAEHPGLTDLGL
jgi:nuclear transport factor 2 (NTF2) superfamily protein